MTTTTATPHAYPNILSPLHATLLCGQVPLFLGALLSDGAAYRYLPKSVAYLPPREELVAMLREAGFADAEHYQLSGGLTQLMVGTRR